MKEKYTGQLPVNRKLLRLFLSAVGFMAVILGFAAALGTWQFSRTALRAPGKVVREIESIDEGLRKELAIVRFTDVSGTVHDVAPSMASRPSTYQVGDNVSVLYKRDAPQRAKVNDFWALWFTSVISVIIAGGFFGMAYFTKTKPVKEPQGEQDAAGQPPTRREFQ